MNVFYTIITRVDFIYRTKTYSGKIKEEKPGWIEDNCKLIYARSDNEAIEKYKNLYLDDPGNYLEWVKTICTDCDIHLLCNGHSSNLPIHVPFFGKVEILKVKPSIRIIDIKGSSEITRPVDNLKHLLSADDFKQWFFDFNLPEYKSSGEPSIALLNNIKENSNE